MISSEAESSYLLDLSGVDTGLQPNPTTTVFCSCTGACKTSRCACKKHERGCSPSRCKCKPSKCSRQKEVASVDLNLLGELNSSDSEPEEFCICDDDCSTTLCYCLAIKQVGCTGQCKCEGQCSNKGETMAEPPLPSTSLPVCEEVKHYCSSRSKLDLEELLVSMASKCPQLWNSIISDKSPGSSKPHHPPPPWCICGRCHHEEDPEDRICCRKKAKNHEHPHFFQLCLDHQTLELALINNCDWLNMPRIFNNAKFRNTAYRQYILWFYGKLGFRNRKRIPSCIKWAIREVYPEPSGVYMGYHEAL